MSAREMRTPREAMRDALLLLGLMALWVVLQAWILPAIGLPTWTSRSFQSAPAP